MISVVNCGPDVYDGATGGYWGEAGEDPGKSGECCGEVGAHAEGNGM